MRKADIRQLGRLCGVLRRPADVAPALCQGRGGQGLGARVLHRA